MSKMRWDVDKCIDFCKKVGVEFLSDKYLNNRTKYKFKCKCGKVFERRWDSFSSRGSYYCSSCSLKEKYESIMLERKRYIGKDGCELLTQKHRKCTEYMKIKCKCGRIHDASWSVILNRGSAKCRICLGYTIDESYIKKYMKEHGIEVIKKCRSSNDTVSRDIYLYRCKCGNIYSKSYESQSKKGYGCPECVGGDMTWTLEAVKSYCKELGSEFLSDSFRRKVDEYKFVCTECGNVFHRTFADLLRYSAVCKSCSSKSKGEDKIREALQLKGIDYIEEKSFDNCIGNKGWKLRFDFFLPEDNILIEFNGQQHYKPIGYFGGNNAFDIQLKNDKIKKKFAEKKGMDLLVIPYWEYNNIEYMINNLLEVSS